MHTLLPSEKENSVLINLIGGWKSFHNVYAYQVITWYTLNILPLYLSMRLQ